MFSRCIPLQNYIFFFQHLSVMLRAGLSLPVALESVAKETRDKRFRAIIETVATEVITGTSFADACARAGSFSLSMVQLFRMGEVQGNLSGIIQQLTTKLKRDAALARRVRGAMLYPGIILTVMIGTGVFMMVSVLPRIVELFASIDAELPLATRAVLAFARWSAVWGGPALVVVALCIGACVAVCRTPRGKRVRDAMLLRMPIVGSLLRHMYLARFSRTLSSLLVASIDLPSALEMAGATVGNTLYADACTRYANAMRTGLYLRTLIQDRPYLFPPLVQQMVATGEETGALATTLAEGAEFYEDAVTVSTESLPALIEPVLIVLLGLAVAVVSVAVMMPMYSLVQQF